VIRLKAIAKIRVDKWITVIVVLLLTIVVSLSAFVTKYNLDSMEKLAQESIYDASRLVTQRVESYFDTLVLFDKLAVKNWVKEEQFLLQAIKNEKFARDLVSHYPFIVSLQFGDKMGNFVMYRKDVVGNINTKIVLTDSHLTEKDRNPRTIWRYYNNETLVREVIVDGIDFDPRTRPWYIGALETETLFMSEPYEFFTDKVIGITAAHQYSVDGDLEGVYSFDLSLDEIVRFINDLELTRHGDTFIVTAERKVIGLLNEPLSQRTYSGFVDALSEEEIMLIDNDSLGQTQKVLLGQPGEMYYVVFNTVLKQFSKPWYIYIRANRSSILSSYTENVLLNGILSVLLAILTLFLLFYRYKQKQVHEHLDVIARRDALTGLLNRYSFEELSQTLINRFNTQGEVFSVVLGDVDDFKMINDTFGHRVGDSILVRLSEIIEGSIRHTDYACRWGGEEFLIVLPGADSQLACSVSRSLLKRIVEKPLKSDVGGIEVTMSFGIATYTGDETMVQLINRADKKLYAAKNSGRNQVSC